MRRFACILLLIAGCSGSDPSPDAGVDASSVGTDAALRDAGPTDAGATRFDAGPGPADAGTDAGLSRESVGVLSLNLHCLSNEGTSFGSHSERFDAIAAEVVAEQVDVLLLQEVCDDGSVNAETALLDALERAGAGRFESHVVFAHVAWEGTPREARESVAVFAATVLDPEDLIHRDQAEAGLQRVAASASVPTALGTLRVLSLHLDHMDAVARTSQAAEAAVIALSEGDPSLAVMVGGDFNARAGSAAYQALPLLGYTDVSAGAGGERIDHVFVHRGAPLQVVETKRLFVAAPVSDHPGVLVRLMASPPAAVTVTRIVAEYDPGPGSHLWLRGDRAPFSWTSGWPMHDLGGGRWRFVGTEFSGEIEFKALVDDTTWQTGANVRAIAGTDIRFTPSF